MRGARIALGPQTSVTQDIAIAGARIESSTQQSRQWSTGPTIGKRASI